MDEQTEGRTDGRTDRESGVTQSLSHFPSSQIRLSQLSFEVSEPSFEVGLPWVRYSWAQSLLISPEQPPPAPA